MAIALVTGSSRGIGEAIARRLAGDGMKVIINHLKSAEESRRLVADIKDAGGEADAVGFDVSSRDAVRHAVDNIQKRFGTIGVLVNNAGILRDRSFKKMSFEEWDDVISVNLNGIMHMCAAVIPGMILQSHGRIVNISSFVAQTGNFGQTNYAAAKAGVIGFSRSLAIEVATAGITVNCICPGFIDTQMWRSIPAHLQSSILARIPVKRVGTPQDVANAVAFLVNDAPYVTGQTINVNGGLYIG